MQASHAVTGGACHACLSAHRSVTSVWSAMEHSVLQRTTRCCGPPFFPLLCTWRPYATPEDAVCVELEALN